jgi:hypothetical protein
MKADGAWQLRGTVNTHRSADDSMQAFVLTPRSFRVRRIAYPIVLIHEPFLPKEKLIGGN